MLNSIQRAGSRVRPHAESLLSWLSSAALIPVPLTRGGELSLTLFALACITLWKGIVPSIPGFAIGLLGLGAVVVAVRAIEPQRLTLWEQIGWIAVATLLLISEMRTVIYDRAQQDKQFSNARRVEQASFRSILSREAETMRENQGQFSATMAKLIDSINTQTGGNTFCYLDLQAFPVFVNGRASPKVNLFLQVVKVGRYPLRDVHMTLTDHNKFQRIIAELKQKRARGDLNQIFEDMAQATRQSETTWPIGDIGVRSKSLGALPMEEGSTQEFEVIIGAFNSTGRIERLKLERLADGRWVKAMLLESDASGRKDFTLIDPRFPRINGHLDVNWPRRTVGREPWDH